MTLRHDKCLLQAQSSSSNTRQMYCSPRKWVFIVDERKRVRVREREIYSRSLQPRKRPQSLRCSIQILWSVSSSSSGRSTMMLRGPPYTGKPAAAGTHVKLTLVVASSLNCFDNHVCMRRFRAKWQQQYCDKSVVGSLPDSYVA